MLTKNQISTIIVMRGLGYKQQEISDALNISRKTVEVKLQLLKHESNATGLYKTYCKYINIVDITLNQIREEFKKDLS